MWWGTGWVNRGWVIDLPAVASRPEAELNVGRPPSLGLRVAVAADDSEDGAGPMRGREAIPTISLARGWLVAWTVGPEPTGRAVRGRQPVQGGGSYVQRN